MNVENTKHKVILGSLIVSLFIFQAEAKETVTIKSNGKDMLNLIF